MNTIAKQKHPKTAHRWRRVETLENRIQHTYGRNKEVRSHSGDCGIGLVLRDVASDAAGIGSGWCSV